MASNNKPTSKVFKYVPEKKTISKKIRNMCYTIATKLLKDKDANPKLYAQYDQGSLGGLSSLANDLFTYYRRTRNKCPPFNFDNSKSWSDYDVGTVVPDVPTTAYEEDNKDEDVAFIEREIMNYKPADTTSEPTDTKDFFDKDVTRNAGWFNFESTTNDNSAPTVRGVNFGANTLEFDFDSVLTSPNDGAVNNLLNNVLFVELMSSTGTLPTKKSKDDAGWDLYSADDYTVPAWGSVLISTQLKMSLPPNHYGRIASRSGLALNSNIEVGAGVIDRSYQGEIKVLLRNFSNVDYSIKTKDRIAQFILSPYNTASIACVNSITEVFGASDRGAGGFGSTGK